MDKPSQKVTKHPKRVEKGKKSYETRMKNLKEQILEEHQLPTSSSTCDPTSSTSSTCDPTSSTSSSTCDPTPSTSSHRSNDTYVYGVGMLAVLVIAVCVFFTYTTFPKNKKLANEKQNQPPKRCQFL